MSSPSRPPITADSSASLSCALTPWHRAGLSVGPPDDEEPRIPARATSCAKAVHDVSDGTGRHFCKTAGTGCSSQVAMATPHQKAPQPLFLMTDS